MSARNRGTELGPSGTLPPPAGSTKDVSRLNLCFSVNLTSPLNLLRVFVSQLEEPTLTFPFSELDLLSSQCDQVGGATEEGVDLPSSLHPTGMHTSGFGCFPMEPEALNLSWISKMQVNQPAVLRRAQQIQARRTVKKEWQAAWLLKAVTFIDLTTLSGDDTSSNIQRLCYKAKYPIREDLLKTLNMHDKGLTTAAVCVYPARVCDAVRALKAAGCTIPVASVATGFPAGQTHLKTRLEEIRLAVEDGATEIDVVINRTLVLTGQWEALYDEIRQFRKACGEAHLKTILATGELGSLTNVYKASMIAMMAGSDFIKTSTGKETVNATFPVAIVMLRAIRDFFWKTGNKVGFKPAGGIRSAKDSLAWLSLVKEELGDEWLTPDLFRIGASTLLSDIERQIYHHVTGRYAAYHDLPMS
ncbi:deoxyribose-phosphate aldolase isoform X8 [Ailuropoda melanoleuca]|uniref:deoxyribose-phosphate aldolase isoform X8 n=1 Tax=Ailuropoda melanoleuca TaxID=9646 RepID=UPI0014940AF2|nr:deoxyribose-phosphate aldolase isoform X8 [Ailuropoda melanoleuca]